MMASKKMGQHAHGQDGPWWDKKLCQRLSAGVDASKTR